MSNLKLRIARLKQDTRRGQPVVVVQVQPGETEAEAVARVNPQPGQLVVIIAR